MKQSSLEQQDKQLQTKIAAQEQKLSSLQLAVQSAQDQWDDRRKQIASDTEVTIAASKAAIESATKEAKAELDTLHASIKKGGEVFLSQRKEQEDHFARVEKEIEDLEYTVKTLSRTNASLQEENRNLTSGIEVRTEKIAELKVTEERLTGNISEIKIQEEELGDELVQLRQRKHDLTEKIAQLEADSAAKTADFTREIEILEAKKADLEQQIINNRAADEKVRENLATWSKILDEKDKNLRIREEQVNQQQKAIARNYDLLNL